MAVNPDAAETIGWPALAATVAAVYGALPGDPEPVVFTANYGQGGAVDRYGPALGLPPAYSGHNGYAEWGPPPDASGPVIVVGTLDQAGAPASFRDCVLAARLGNPAAVENEEQGAPVWTCAGTRRPWSELWPELERLG